jgi:hypothetical protein
MSRGLTALRAALGAVGGVTDALQERERIAAQRQKEEEVMARQRRLDEAAIRAEQRQAIGSGMMAADRLAGMTMPGATPLASMQPTLRQKIGDTEYVYAPEIARAEKHRESVMAQSLERAEAARSRTAKIESLVGTGVDRSTATRAVDMDAKFSDLQPKDQITPYQREQLKLQRERLDYDQKRDQQREVEQPVKIPASDRRSMTELESSVRELDNAIKAVEGAPNAFGLKTMLPNPILSRQGGVKPRADVTGAIVKLRRTEFGTAMSKQEAASGVSLFPSIGGMTGGDSPAAITEKLTSLKEKALLELNTKREFYGMKPFAPNAASTPTTPTGGGAANVDAARYKSDPKYKAWVDSQGGR